ncbi:PAP2-domain-containing protein [Coniochaeta ligniaria NRRL 30616]|uniref:PAP2-domain-containing protein n=1 Tax=Coniochaeta ligniaria NRRL 30616 TaxID=1408157 RepID=A0A1J7I5Y1_9PEZI|nr:PAP2-domain-containing protein [Coniochaeta ligniaria NRRL 30616]
MTQHNHDSGYGSELSTHEKVQQHTMNGTVGGHSHPHGDSKQAADQQTVDAGLKSLDHCMLQNHMCPSTYTCLSHKKPSLTSCSPTDRQRLSPWRYYLRAQLLPLVRWETPYLAYMQAKMRTPALDRYFAISANLGTHTFFMIGLPILFWCGWPGFGKGLVHILAAGVFFTGFIKDMLSLPRPLSPPLHRITMSGSVALEYGFPSTHSANAVSVAVYGILVLRSADNIFSPAVTLLLEALAWFYALSIIIGRLYCGMHGFLDVIFGSVLGATISLVEFHYGPALEAWEQSSSSYLVPLAIATLIVIMVRVHPEPVDDCPCFDDSVAFAGTIIGVEAGTWRFGKHSPFSAIYHGPQASFDLGALGVPTSVVRILVGVLVIFAWREVTKKTLHRALPHLFRVIETYGLDLPRRFFVPASEYKKVPERLRDDNVLPSVSDFGKVVNSIRGPTRGRAVSVGPQSAADAYETLAYRERRRRESVGSEEGGVKPRRSLGELRENGHVGLGAEGHHGQATASGVQQNGRLKEFESQMGTGTVVVSSPASPEREMGEGEAEPDIYVGQQDELGAKEMFSRLVKPRVRYDVEVVTKLVVYAGMFLVLLLWFGLLGEGGALTTPHSYSSCRYDELCFGPETNSGTGIGGLAVDGIPTLFEFIGLGAGHLALR